MGVRRLVPVIHPATQDYFRRVVGRGGAYPSRGVLFQVDLIIRDLIDLGIWYILDGLYLLGSQDTGNAYTNLISSSFNITATGGTFTANKGYTGASGAFLATGYIPSSAGKNMTLNSGSIFLWQNTADAQGDGCGADDGTRSTMVSIFSTSQFGQINGSDVDVSVTAGAAPGLYLASRYNSTAIDLWNNNILKGNQTAAASTGLPTTQIMASNENTTTLYDNGQVSLMGFGGGIDQARASKMYPIFHPYLQSVVGAA